MTAKWKSAFSKFDRFGKYAMVIAVVILISFLYPSSIKFKYEFQKGQIWKYPALEAPFDFAIKKPDTQIREDRERLEQEFSPFYRLNPELAGAKQKDFEAAFEQHIASLTKESSEDIRRLSEKYLVAGKRLLGKIFDRGIIELAPEHRDKGRDFVINVVQGNTSYKRTLPSFLTLEQAKEIMQDSISELKLPASNFLIPLLSDALMPAITYDEELTDKLKEQALNELVSTKGIVRKGELIVTNGAVVTDEVYEKLASFREMFQEDVISEKSSLTVYIGYLLLTGLILGAFMMYLQSYRKEIIDQWNYLAFVLMWLVIFSYLTFSVEKVNELSAYVIPYCIVPIVVRHFFTYRLAFFTHVVVVLIAGFLTSLGYQFTFMQIVAGVVAVLAVADARDWSKFFRSVLYIMLTYVLAYLGLSLIEEGDLSSVDWSVYTWLLFNALLTFLAFPLIPLMERTFGFTSSISLVELSDLNRPILRELSMNAPGTMQHSLQVANLCEAAANEIGANPLLARVGALYHDIGKIQNPEYFIENQVNSSPHDGLGNLESAEIIINHVPLGVKLAKKHHLPQRIINFITSHHGTTKVEYFYRNFLKDNPGTEVDESKFTYPGPKPVTKEETILMLADSIEATSKSLKNHTANDLDELVDNIIAAKIEKKQFEQSKLTFSDIEKCRAVFKKMLRSIYHIRIEYPKEAAE